MIEIERTNEKGDKVVAFTHQNYLSSHFSSEIDRLTKKYQTTSNVVMYGTTIASYWVLWHLFQALQNVPVLNNLVSTKLSFKGKYLAVSLGAGLITSLFASIIMANSLVSSKQNLLKNEVFPAWFQKDRVVNPDRVFFELDDNRNNEPSIWHSAM